MANVIHNKIVAIAPTIHIEMTGGRKVVMPERPVEQQVSGLPVGRNPESMFQHKKFE